MLFRYDNTVFAGVTKIHGNLYVDPGVGGTEFDLGAILPDPHQRAFGDPPYAK